MRYKSFAASPSAIARSLERVGEWRSIPILRDALYPALTQRTVVVCQHFARSSADQIEFERAHSQRRFAALHQSAQQCLEPHHEFNKREGLGEIVIAARAKPAHPVVNRAKGAQYQNRRANLVLPQGLDNRQPIDFGKESVDDDHVLLGGPRVLQPSSSGHRPFYMEATMNELRHDLFRLVGILDEQHLVTMWLCDSARHCLARSGRL
jgi:hypothetical protein